jgi:hypothetical protein
MFPTVFSFGAKKTLLCVNKQHYLLWSKFPYYFQSSVKDLKYIQYLAGVLGTPLPLKAQENKTHLKTQHLN